MILYLILWRNICFGYLLELPQWGNSNKYPKRMFKEEIRMKQDLSYISICSLSILYNSNFIFMVTSLGANAVAVSRVHCSFPTARSKAVLFSLQLFFVSASMVSNVAFVLLLFVPHLAFFCCLGKAALRICGTLREHAYSNILKIAPPQNWKSSDKNSDIFSYFCSKHRLWVLVRTASPRRF